MSILLLYMDLLFLGKVKIFSDFVPGTMNSKSNTMFTQKMREAVFTSKVKVDIYARSQQNLGILVPNGLSR